MNPTFTIFVPTIGRSTLPATLRALKAQPWRDGDEVVLLSDANHDYVHECWDNVGLPGWHFSCVDGPLGHFGYGLLNRYGHEAHGTHVCHIREDVLATSDMLAKLRQACVIWPEHMHLFRMYDFQGRQILWKSQEIREGQLTGENAIFPNDPRLVGKWGLRHLGDFDFISHASTIFPHVWHDDVILFHNPPWIDIG